MSTVYHLYDRGAETRSTTNLGCRVLEKHFGHHHHITLSCPKPYIHSDRRKRSTCTPARTARS